jgi:hypothetical protein
MDDADRLFQAVERDVGQQGTDHASHNLANRVFEFSVTVPRQELHPRYGEGFHGAPVNQGSAKNRVAPRADGGDHDPQWEEGAQGAARPGEV